jgi:hypothetical protein
MENENLELYPRFSTNLEISELQQDNQLTLEGKKTLVFQKKQQQQANVCV